MKIDNFFRVKAAQCLQGRSHVRGCRLAADSSSVNSLSRIRSAGLGNEGVSITPLLRSCLAYLIILQSGQPILRSGERYSLAADV